MTDPRALLRAALRDDLATFAKRVFRELHPSETFQDNWHFDAIAHRLDQARLGHDKRQIITLPPRMAKSTLGSVALPAFVLGHDPGARIVCVSYSTDLAASFARQFRKVVTSGWYQELHSAMVLSKTSEDVMETTRGGARRSTSFESGITGHGGSMIIIDDPLTPAHAHSEAARRKAIDFYKQSLVSRFDNPAEGRMILLMQRLHEDDLAGFLLRTGGFSHLDLPAIAIEDEAIPLGHGRVHRRRAGDLLDPARYPRDELDRLRALQSAADFSAQFQQRPIADQGNMLKRDWIGRYETPPVLAGMQITQSWDTALKGNVKADYSVCTTWASRDERHYLIDVFREQLDFPELVEASLALHGRWPVDVVLVEDQGSGSGLISVLAKRHGIYALEQRSRDDKVTRLSRASLYFEKGQVLFPNQAPWLAALEHELMAFPHGRNDDQVDSISQYINWAHGRLGNEFRYSRLFDTPDPSPETLMDILAAIPRW